MSILNLTILDVDFPARSKNQAATLRYPDNGLLSAARLGAKVAKGEMKWG